MDIQEMSSHSAPQKRKRDIICMQEPSAHAPDSTDIEVGQTILRIKLQSRSMVSFLRSERQSWTDDPLKFVGTEISPLLKKDKIKELLHAFTYRMTSGEHVLMVKWLLAFAFHRLYQGRQISGSNEIRGFGRVASELVSESERVSILLLAPSFSRRKQGNKESRKQIVSDLKADFEFSFQMAEYDSLARAIVMAICEKLDPDIILTEPATAPREDLTSDQRNVLSLLCVVHPLPVPTMLFQRYATSRMTWNSEGELVRLAPCTSPLHETLKDSNKSLRALDYLVSSSIVQISSGPLGGNNYSVTEEIRNVVFANHSLSLTKIRQATLLAVAHAFPGSPTEIAFSDTGRELSGLFRHVFTDSQAWQHEIEPGSTSGFSILLTLLLSSRFQGNDWKRRAVNTVSNILTSKAMSHDINTSYLRLCAAQRTMDIKRRIPKLCIYGSEGSLAEELPVDPRSNACIGALLRSKAHNLVMEGPGDLNGALEQLAKFKPFRQTQSEMEKYEGLEHLFLRAKISHWKGCFAEATETLYSILGSEVEDVSMPDDFTRRVTGHLVASLCEQGQLDEAETVARIALEGLEELESGGLSRVKLKGYIDLQLSMAGVLICQVLRHKLHGTSTHLDVDNNLDRLHRIYAKVGRRFPSGQTQQPILGSRISNLRFLLGRAFTVQLSGNLDEAHLQWEQARKSAEECKDSVTDFTPMIINYCCGHILKEKGNNEDSQRLLQVASMQYEVTGRQYWWTGMGTYWLSWLMTLTPLPVPTR